MLKSLKLISDPTRLRILMLVEHEALSVVELQEVLGMGQSRISTQLSQLKAEGLVSDERSGKNNNYTCSAEPELLEVARAAAATSGTSAAAARATTSSSGSALHE